MIKITKTWLQKQKACKSGISWFEKRKLKTVKTIVPALLQDGYFDYARWLLSRLLTHPQQVQWAIYCAKLVIDRFEEKYPGDDRPRKAIQAAKDFLAGKISAAYAAYAAAYAANAAYAAAYAANARKGAEKKIVNFAMKLLGEIK